MGLRPSCKGSQIIPFHKIWELMKKILSNSENLHSQKWAWNIAVLASVFFLIYLPSKESFSKSTPSSGYFDLLSLLPAGIYFTLLVTLLGSFAAVLVGLDFENKKNEKSKIRKIRKKKKRKNM